MLGVFLSEARGRSSKTDPVFLFALAFLLRGSFYAAWDNAGISSAE